MSGQKETKWYKIVLDGPGGSLMCHGTDQNTRDLEARDG